MSHVQKQILFSVFLANLAATLKVVTKAQSFPKLLLTFP